MPGKKDKSGPNAETWALAAWITSLFYVLPLGRYSFVGEESDFRIYDFAFIGFFLLFGLQRLSDVGRLLKDRSNYHRLVAGFLCLVWLSMLVTIVASKGATPAWATLRAIRFTGYLSLSAFVVVIANTRRKLRFLWWVFGLNVLAQLILSTLQAADILPNLWPDYWHLYGTTFHTGTLSPHHKQLGVVALLGTGAFLAGVSVTRRKVLAMFLAAAMALSIIVPLSLGSRTSWLGAGAFALAYVFARRKLPVAPLLTVAAAAGIMLALGEDAILDPLERTLDARFFHVVDTRGVEGLYDSRTHIYFELMPEALSKYPWLLITGSGFQNVSRFLRASGAHNNYLQAWFELGIVGFIVFLKMLASIARAMQSLARDAVTLEDRAFAETGWAVFIALLATMFVGETLWAQYSMFTLAGQIMTYIGLATVPAYYSWGTRAA